MLENVYPILRQQVVIYNIGTAVTQKDILLNTAYLVVGFHCPEVSVEIERKFNAINLKPYELAVNRYSGSDFKYDMTQLQSPGVRTIKNLDLIEAGTTNSDNKVIIVVAYLEFINI